MKPDLLDPVVLRYNVKFPVENGTVLPVICNPSYYILNGDRTIICSNGTWEGEANCTGMLINLYNTLKHLKGQFNNGMVASVDANSWTCV